MTLHMIEEWEGEAGGERKRDRSGSFKQFAAAHQPTIAPLKLINLCCWRKYLHLFHDFTPVQQMRSLIWRFVLRGIKYGVLVGLIALFGMTSAREMSRKEEIRRVLLAEMRKTRCTIGSEREWCTRLIHSIIKRFLLAYYTGRRENTRGKGREREREVFNRASKSRALRTVQESRL